MVEFHGWTLPLQFSGILAEHRAVREHVGIFDVSHMGKISVEGVEVEAWLDRLSPNPVPRVEGRARYTHLLREDGTILDDVIIMNIGAKGFLMVCNAGTREAVVGWLRQHSEGQAIRDMTLDIACMALQGPRAAPLLSILAGGKVTGMRPFHGRTVEVILPEGLGAETPKAPKASPVPLETVGWGAPPSSFALGLAPGVAPQVAAPEVVAAPQPAAEPVLVTRTGYTGEDGFEIFASDHVAEALWPLLLQLGERFGLKPCGLGARDTLRMEMGYLLSGQDFDSQRTTLETGHDWVIKWDHEFIGREALEAQRRRGGYRRWTGMVVGTRGIPRRGNRVMAEGKVVGEVTSGTLSPTLGQGIALGYLEEAYSSPGTEVCIEVRGRELGARVVKPPFIRPRGRGDGPGT
jgi:aminomethyltransferase